MGARLSTWRARFERPRSSLPINSVGLERADCEHVINRQVRACQTENAAHQCLPVPNGQRISGERGGEADERVRCMRVLGAGHLLDIRSPKPPTDRVPGITRPVNRCTRACPNREEFGGGRQRLPSADNGNGRSYCSAQDHGKRTVRSDVKPQREPCDSLALREPSCGACFLRYFSHLSIPAPNGQRISGERRAEGDERVRCMRVLGAALIDRAPCRLRH